MATSPEPSLNGTSSVARSVVQLDELGQLKRQLLQAEVRLAKARANTAGAEADVKVLSAKLRAITR